MPRGRVAPGGNKGGHWRARGRSTRAAPPCGGAFRYRARAESFLCARNSLRGTYQHDADIHHVGIGGARDHQIAERFEVAVGIVFVQVTAGVRIAAEGLPIGDGAGGIGGPSLPSVPALKTTTFLRPAMSMAAARTNS